MLTQELVEKTIAFHGHHCPGLTIGMHAGEWCLAELGSAIDEEIVAVTETDMCGVDAIQFLTGCTFGKGNLIFLDYGKVAFSFFRRSDGKSARLLFSRSLTQDLHEKQDQLDLNDTEARQAVRREMIDRMMNADSNEMFVFGPAQTNLPHKARIHQSLPCCVCGEDVMETRLIEKNHKRICIPCSEKS